MKGGNMHKMRGKHFSVALIALVFITVSLWSLETKPLATTLLSVEDRLYLPSPDVILAASHVSEDIVKPKEHPIQEDSHLYVKTGSESKGLVSDGSDVGSIVSSRVEEDGRNSTSSVYNNDNKDAHQLDHKDSKSPIEKKVCNYAKGRWVVDKKRALYSGSQCKQWLSEMWACRLTQRPDFSYENYRWQPENCEMPEFVRSEFLERMRDKTIAFVGDSLGRQQFQSLMCMVTGGEDNPKVQDVGNEYGFTLAPGSVRPDGWAFRFPETNTTILYHWSACLCDLEPLNATNPAGEVAMHLDRPPSFLKRFLPSFDVLILNTGHHWNRGKVNANHWVMYVDGKPLKNKRLLMIGNAKNLTVHSIAKWVDNQIRYHHRQVKAFFRTISPRHFFNGEWNTGGSCENTTPLAKGSEVVQDESSDPLIAGAVKGTKVKLLDITALSTLRDEGHISRYSVRVSAIQDCLHWCLPGIPDTWNEIVAAQI